MIFKKMLTHSDFGYNQARITDISLKDLQVENSHYFCVGWTCLARGGGLFSIDGTTGLLLEEATVYSTTIHGLKTSDISSRVW
jgi:hypothetical protein